MFMWFDLLMTKMFSYASGCKPTWNCVMVSEWLEAKLSANQMPWDNRKTW